MTGDPTLPQTRISVTVEAMREFATRIFVDLGVPRGDAELITDVHMDAELRGEESHGIRLLLPHFGRIKAGSIRPVARLDLLVDRGAIALYDAHHSLGQVAAAAAMQRAIDKARSHGIGAVGVRNANSFTSAKYYPLMATRQGMIGLAYTNSRPMMPPVGGVTAKLGNNPFSIAAPSSDGPPFVLDMACAVAREKIWQAEAEGRTIPLGWALGPDGVPTTDPKTALDGGVLLPFGGHKAFGLAMAHEVLTSLLCGGDVFTGDGTGFRPYDNLYRASQLFIAIDIESFIPLTDFRRRLDGFLRDVRATPVQDGFSEIVLPGERGYRLKAERERGALRLSESLVQEFLEYAAGLGTSIPDELCRFAPRPSHHSTPSND